MASKCTFLLTFLISGLACVMLVISLAAWTENDCQTLKSTAWAKSEVSVTKFGITGTGSVFVGLRGWATDLDIANHDIGCQYNSFAIAEGVFGFGDDCEDAGKMALGGGLVALFCIALGCLLSLTRCCNNGNCLRTLTIILPLISVILAAAAAGYFQHQCTQEINDLAVSMGTDDANTVLKPFVGFGAAVCAVLLSALVAILHCCAKPDSHGDRTVVLLR